MINLFFMEKEQRGLMINTTKVPLSKGAPHGKRKNRRRRIWTA